MKVLANPFLELNPYFSDSKLEDRVLFINEEASNIPKVFVNNYVNYCLYIAGAAQISKTISNYQILAKLLKGTFNMGINAYEEYASWELANADNIMSPKEEAYLSFLDTHLHYFHALDKLNFRFALSPFSTATFFKETWQNQQTYINFEKLVVELNKYQEFLVNWCRFSLLNSCTITDEKDFTTIKNQLFNIDALFGNPNLKYEHKKSILHTIKSNIELASRDFYAATALSGIIISPHLFMREELKRKQNELEKEVAVKAKDWNTKIKLKPLYDEQISLDFPTHVFKNKEAYHLFHIIAKGMTQHVQISFLFRQMSEGETPALIVCRDAVFRTWFNESKYKLELDIVTKRLADTTTADRMLLYNLTKSFLKLENP